MQNQEESASSNNEDSADIMHNKEESATLNDTKDSADIMHNKEEGCYFER